ncbi:hypothetical protein EVAR_98206_1 [Eumeta japonica]|uniref:Uncharacterized protein n=1 Tax=Eumeta variegata TaxID=151549 RepID=A0A4C1Y416_EUMVA|nr:hypothetical protein EVAR_98206_1 [Eumeta japonica]
MALLRRPFVNDNTSEPGIERQLIEEMFKHFRFKLNYELFNNGRGERNGFGKWTGALKYIHTRQRHLLFGGIFPDNEVHEDFESTSPYLRDSYTWVVPRAKQLDPWLSLLAKLIDVLTNPFYQSQIHNVDEMVQSGLRWGGLEEVFDLYENSSEPVDQIIKEGWIFIEDMERALVDVTVHRNFFDALQPFNSVSFIVTYAAT